jgi:hypothetical protein
VAHLADFSNGFWCSARMSYGLSYHVRRKARPLPSKEQIVSESEPFRSSHPGSIGGATPRTERVHIAATVNRVANRQRLPPQSVPKLSDKSYAGSNIEREGGATSARGLVAIPPMAFELF